MKNPVKKNVKLKVNEGFMTSRPGKHKKESSINPIRKIIYLK